MLPKWRAHAGARLLFALVVGTQVAGWRCCAQNQVGLLTVSTSRARQYWLAAERLAQSADLARLAPCSAVAQGEAACAEAFYESSQRRSEPFPGTWNNNVLVSLANRVSKSTPSVIRLTHMARSRD